MILYLTSGSSLVAQLVKNLPAMQRPGFNPKDETVPWRRERLILQCSGLENPMDCLVHGVSKSWT